jgi:hypothetical protein
MIHRENVERYGGTLPELANDLGDLRYDAVVVFLEALAAKLEEDAAADTARGRPKLAAALRGGASGAMAAAAQIKVAWSISAPHM